MERRPTAQHSSAPSPDGHAVIPRRTRRRSALDRRSCVVVLVRDVVAPGRHVALVVGDQHRDVSHEAIRRGPVPVLLARLEEDTITRADDLDRAAPALGKTDPLEDIDGLPVRMLVPCRSRAGREMDAARAQT